MNSIIKAISFISIISMLNACGVEISDTSGDSHHTVTVPADDFAAYTIYLEDEFGDLEEIYRDCINLDDPFDDSGSVHVDLEFRSDDLFMSWENTGSSLFLQFRDGNSRLLYDDRIPTFKFRQGDVVEFSIGGGFGPDYLIAFEGPFCAL